MRRTLGLAALAAGLGAALLPAAPASAYCSPVFYAATGYCNECYLAGATYHRADERSGGLLPDQQFACLA